MRSAYCVFLAKKEQSEFKYSIGISGLFGLTILTVLLVPMYYIHVPSTFSTNPYHRLEDIFDAFGEVRDNPWIGAALLLTVIRSLFMLYFNFVS